MQASLHPGPRALRRGPLTAERVPLVAVRAPTLLWTVCGHGRYIQSCRMSGDPDKLSLPRFVGWMVDSISGLHRMHHGDRHALLHRDLKPKNMLVFERPASDGAGSSPTLGADPDVVVKLGDLGLAKEIEGTLHSLVRSSVGAGTLLTMAPEAMGGNYGAHGDVFAWGVSMCMAACQALPVPPVPVGATRDAITELGIQLLSDYNERVGRVLEHSMKLNYNKRPCSTEVRDQLMQATGLWPDLGEGWLFACLMYTMFTGSGCVLGGGVYTLELSYRVGGG